MAHSKVSALFEPLNSRKTRLKLYKYSFKGKTRTARGFLSPGGRGSRFYYNCCSGQRIPLLFFLRLSSYISANGKNSVSLIIPPIPSSLLPFFYAIFFPPSIPTLLLPLLLPCRCHDNSSTAPFMCWRPGLLFL